MPQIQIIPRPPAKTNQNLQNMLQLLQMGAQNYQGYQQKQTGLQQQGQLAQALFGGNQEKEKLFASLSPEQQLKAYELMNKPPPGGVSAQSVPPQIAQKIPEILNANKDATADELAVKLDEAGIPRAYSNSYIENRRRMDEAKEKKETKSSEIGRKEQIEFHKESQKYDEKLSEQADSANKKLKAIERQEQILPKLTNKDRIQTALFTGTKFQDLVKSKNAQEFDSLVLPMIEGMRAMFGTRLSDADLRLVLQKIATSEKNSEANQSILNWQKLEAKMDIEKRKIGDEIRKENNGLRPIDYQEQIRKRMDEKFGDEIEKEAQKIMSLKDDPEESAKITERVKVPPGTPLNTKAIDLYLKLSKNDPEKAKQMAIEDGYQF